MKYRRRPVVIDAVQWDGIHIDPIWDLDREKNTQPFSLDGSGHLMIHTREGVMSASPGDWIIRGVAGEFYPCKPDIFAATYEAAES